jgi:hypothetical protein
MKYIFVAGAPGSKWSSVVKNIYWSPDLDQTDYSDARTYYHDASGTMDLMHLGVYFDPGMEFALPERLDSLSRSQLENIFDQPFTGQGVRIIKSHLFSEYIDFLKTTFPEIPIITVERDDDACLGWWVKCGHFDITYPLYHSYFRDLKNMAAIIRRQNAAIKRAQQQYPGQQPRTNLQLARMLGIRLPPAEYQQTYAENDIRVTVI